MRHLRAATAFVVMPAGCRRWKYVASPLRAVMPLNSFSSISMVVKARFVVFLFALHILEGGCGTKLKDWHLGLDEYFKKIDVDGDGQVAPAEAKRFIRQTLGTTHEGELSDAIVQMTSNLDGTDQGSTISEKEVEAHLRKLMQVRQAMFSLRAWQDMCMCRVS